MGGSCISKDIPKGKQMIKNKTKGDYNIEKSPFGKSNKNAATIFTCFLAGKC